MNAFNNYHIMGLVLPGDLYYLLISEVSAVFLLMWLLILLSLVLNLLNSLIYRVINLAALSVLVVGCWACVTDFTVLYIVYILAFVGAVIMLFLSIVLMLPASAIASESYQVKEGFIAIFLVTELVYSDVIHTL